jgi:hypothetical protein
MAVGPDSPLARSLTMSGCGACFEVQCGNNATPPEVRLGAARIRLCPCLASDPSACRPPHACLFLQAAGCFTSPSAGVAVTLVDRCPDCSGESLGMGRLQAGR